MNCLKSINVIEITHGRPSLVVAYNDNEQAKKFFKKLAKENNINIKDDELNNCIYNKVYENNEYKLFLVDSIELSGKQWEKK